MVKISQLLMVAAAISVLPAQAAEAWGPVQKKYIAHGWDLLAVTPEEVLAHADAFDRTAIDGVTLMIRQRLGDGRTISHSSVMTDPLWPRDELKGHIATFREIVKHPSLKESFLSSWWAPRKRLAWTDDAAWRTFAANMGTIAWLAKEGGLRGVLVDAEDYPKSEQYRLQAGDPAYDETARLARKRGAEVFSAIFREYPDVTFLSFWMLSLNPRYLSSNDPMGDARANGSLWPWFVNGMLDVMPATAKFVDGNEHAYRYEAEKGQFYRSACQQRTGALGLVAPENRQKYLAQLRAGFGLYLDSYINPTNSNWYFGPVNGSRLTHYAQNLAQATAAADEYVWVYGEKRSWVPWKGTKNTRFQGVETWDDALPGFSDEMGGVKDPRGYCRRRLGQMRKEGVLTNLVDGVKRPWGTWQHEKKPKGKMGQEGSGVFLEGAPNGCHLVHIHGVKPGETFAVSLKMKGTGGSSIVYWQKDGHWQWGLAGVPISFATGTEAEWRTGEALVRVPEGADTLVLQLCGKQRPGERVVFNQVEIVEL